MPGNSLTVPAAFESLSEIAAFVVAHADAAGLGAQSRYRLRLAVDEIATNAIIHGRAGEARAGADGAAPLRLFAELGPQTLTIVLEDAGAAFDPRRAPPPDDLDLPPEQRRIGGLGIHLALGGVDRFSYERVGDRNRNVFLMDRPTAPG